MEKFEIKPASRVHATQLAPRLRPADQLEVYRASGMNSLDALIDSVAVSDEDMCWTAMLAGHPVAMFGTNELVNDGTEDTIGGIWLLASPAIYTNKRDFHRNCQKYLDKMHERYRYLTNFVDADNLVTMQWLPRLGFAPVQKIEDFGVQGTPFIQYVSER